MIRRIVDFALRERILVAAMTFLLLVWGVISFIKLPVEAYPDVANNWVQVITQWPGRAAEEVEQQVTIPIETQMAGLRDMTNVRSVSTFGLCLNLRPVAFSSRGTASATPNPPPMSPTASPVKSDAAISR